MSREEAIKIIDFDRRLCNRADELGRENGEALDMALEALEQEPCEDVVSRKDVHDMLENLPVTVEDKWFNWLQKACIRLAELPPVTHQPKTGHWVYRNGIRYCEFCGASNNTAYANYCPNCGTKMVEPQESEDWACKGCWCDDGEVHVECVFCDKIGGEE